MSKQVKTKFAARIKECADVIAAVGVIGAALVGVGTWCTAQINASTNQKIDSLSEQLTDLKLDATRSQLLTLISNYPDNESEIMKVAQYYFGTLKGDWYATTIFTKWASDHGISTDELTFMKEVLK